jgi:peptide/nickel transport system substrate-binding protein
MRAGPFRQWRAPEAVLAMTVALLITDCESRRTDDRVARATSQNSREVSPERQAPQFGGTLRVAQKAEPETFNPIAAIGTGSRDILGLLNADLIHINRRTLRTEPALAERWEVSADGREYTIHLRPGLQFSDGHSMNADDVLFTFRVHLDEKVHSTQRDLLLINGQPVKVTKVDLLTVRVRLPAPYAAAERLFDGFAILPRHLLSERYRSGNLTLAWGLDSAPAHIAGLGPFRLQEYVPGQRIMLGRNPFYWKTDAAGRKLPFLDRIIVQFVPSEDNQVIRLRAGELDIVDALTARNYAALRGDEQAGRVQLFDSGPGLEYNFLVFNLNDPGANASGEAKRRYSWFSQLSFRRAVSAAIDRQAVVRLVYRGLGHVLRGPVTKGNTLWENLAVPVDTHSTARARSLLGQASFSWKDGLLTDSQGNSVEFSILVSATSSERRQIAAIVQEDLRQVGMKVSVVALDSRAVNDRILNRGDYDSAVMALAGADTDPNSDMNVWTAHGRLRVWNRSPGATEWEREADSQMRQQMVTPDYRQRKRMFDRVQQLIAENLPIICIASPHILSAARSGVRGLQPAPMRPYALWNADVLSLSAGAAEH